MTNIGLSHFVERACLEKFQICAFWAKSRPKIANNGLKWTIWTLIKIESLILAGITFKWCIMSFIILCKPHFRENSKMRLLELKYTKIRPFFWNFIEHELLVLESPLNDEQYCPTLFSNSCMFGKIPKFGTPGPK